MRTFKTEGIVIKRRNFNEADRIITIFTKEYGKMQLKAQGVRKIVSKRSSHIELLNLVSISFYRGSKLPVLVEAQSVYDFSLIKEDLEKTGLAYHLCELVDGLTAEDEGNHAGFELLYKTLKELETADDVQILIHGFEVELLTMLGFWHQNEEDSKTADTHQFIESILERRLKSRRIFSKLS